MLTGKKKYILNLILIYLVILLLSMLVHAILKSANYRGPFKGQVLDQNTLKPIEGVVVFVEWDIGNPGGGESYFDAKEVLTDNNGNFNIRKNWSFNPWRNIAMGSSVIIFKAGYGSVSTGYWPGFKEKSEDLRRRKGSYYVGFEGNTILFYLYKLKTLEDYRSNDQPEPGDVPLEKYKLLRAERNRQTDVYRMEQGEMK